MRTVQIRRQHQTPLPTDIETLRRLLSERDAQLVEHQIEITRLKLENAILRRARFGRSSEQLDSEVEQLELTLEELESSKADIIQRVVRAKLPPPAYFIPCRSTISPHAGPGFHAMPVRDFTACRSRISRDAGPD